MSANCNLYFERRFDASPDTSIRQVTAGAVARSENRKRDIAGWIVISTLTAFIFMVAIYDVYWSFKTQDTLAAMEQNPLGTFLINLDGGDIALFMTAKMVGTMVVVTVVPLLYAFRRRIAQAVAVALALFQGMLFLYLNFGDAMPIFASF